MPETTTAAPPTTTNYKAATAPDRRDPDMDYERRDAMLDVAFDHPTAPLPDEGRQPRTEAGRRLFTDVDPGDMWESDGVTWADIIAVEDEAAAAALRAERAARERLEAALRHVLSSHLPGNFHCKTAGAALAPATGEGAE